MSQRLKGLKDGAGATVRDLGADTQAVLDGQTCGSSVAGLRGEDSIAELCRREGIAESLYYSWSKEFLEAGKKRLAGDTARQAHPRVRGVKDLQAARCATSRRRWPEQMLENRLLKKSMTGDGGDGVDVRRPRSWRSSAWSND